jgi:O-antigen/teichoic acid export membrane protein
VLAAMVRFYYEQKEERERAAVVTSCTLLVTLTAFTLCGLALACVPSLTPLLLSQGAVVTDQELREVCTLLLILVPFQLATVSGNYYLYTVKRSSLFTGIQTAKLFLEVGFNVYLMGVRGLGVRGFLISMLIGEVLTSLGLLGWMLARLGARVDLRLLKPMLRYAAPLVPVGLLQLLLHHVDKRILLELGGQEAAGVYGFGYRIAYLVTNMVLGPFVVTWQPWIFAVQDPLERARLVSRVSTYAVLAIAAASLGVILFGRQAALVLAGDPAFHAAYRVVPFLTLGYVFWALYNVTQTPLLLEKRTGRLVYVNFGAVVLNVALNFALIPSQGIVGAALATLLTFAVLAALGMVASRRAAGVRFEFARLGATALAVTLGGSAAFALDSAEEGEHLGLLAALAIKSAVLLSILAGLWFGVLAAQERTQFLTWARQKLRRKPA